MKSGGSSTGDSRRQKLKRDGLFVKATEEVGTLKETLKNTILSETTKIAEELGKERVPQICNGLRAITEKEEKEESVRYIKLSKKHLPFGYFKR